MSLGCFRTVDREGTFGKYSSRLYGKHRSKRTCSPCWMCGIKCIWAYSTVLRRRKNLDGWFGINLLKVNLNALVYVLECNAGSNERVNWMSTDLHMQWVRAVYVTGRKIDNHDEIVNACSSRSFGPTPIVDINQGFFWSEANQIVVLHIPAELSQDKNSWCFKLFDHRRRRP